MSNSLYDHGREAFLTGSINWSSDTIKVVLVQTSSGYVVSLSGDQYKSSIAGGYIVAGPSTLGSKTTTSGAADAADVTFSAVSGSTVGAIVIYKFVTGDSDSPLLAYIDTATGLPITPNGGDIILSWDNGTNRIFKL